MTEYALTDADGTVRWRGTIDPPPGGGLPTGWTQDEFDPANVSTNSGRLMGGPSSTLELRGGDLTTPGDIDLVGGTSDGDGDGGNVFLNAGAGLNSTDGGGVDIRAGDSGVSGGAGSLTMRGGQGLGTANGGDASLAPGVAVGSGDDGALNLKDAAGAIVIRIDAGGLGFFGTSATTQPEVPAVPLVQDVVDALVTLGLVTQAS